MSAVQGENDSRKLGRAFRIAELVHVASRQTARLSALMSAYIIGVISNAASSPNVKGPGDLVTSVYGPHGRPIAWVNIAITILAILAPATYLVFRGLVGRTSQAVQLSAQLDRYVSEGIREFSRGRIAWGEEIVIQSCPKITEGWRPEEVRIVREPTTYSFSSGDMAEAFDRWSRTTTEDTRQLSVKYRIVDNPSSFSDSPMVEIRVEENTWAQARFINKNWALLENPRRRLIRQTLSGEIDYPHIFCMHLTVATADGWILLTERSYKVAFDPNAWSCSIEEQLSENDFKGPETEVVSKWACRALMEELGLSTAEAQRASARTLAVFLEADRLNTGLATLVTLNITKRELDAIIETRPREDYEFQDWLFVPWSDLAGELIHPTRRYHPSSGLRMFLSGVVHYGVFGFAERLEAASRRPRVPRQR